MRAYSSDLRERVVAAVRDTDLTQPEIAKMFSVSLSSVETWWRTFRQTERLQPLPFAGGRKRVLQPHAQVIRDAVAQQPDATLTELCSLVAAQTGVQAKPNMMCRELQILKLPPKKSRYTIASGKRRVCKAYGLSISPRPKPACGSWSNISNSSMNAVRIWG